MEKCYITSWDDKVISTISSRDPRLRDNMVENLNNIGHWSHIDRESVLIWNQFTVQNNLFCGRLTALQKMLMIKRSPIGQWFVLISWWCYQPTHLCNELLCCIRVSHNFPTFEIKNEYMIFIHKTPKQTGMQSYGT